MRTVAELKLLSQGQRQTFRRTVSSEVYLTDEGALSVCKLLDNYHEMEMAMLVDTSSYVILDIAATMTRHPFENCVHSFDSYKRLIGLRVLGGGVLHKVHQLIPRVDGCTHLYTALEACFRALFIGAGYEQMLGETKSEGQTHDLVYLRQLPLTKDTCVSFRTDGKEPESPEAFLKRTGEDSDHPSEK